MAEISPTILHQTVLFSMASGSSSTIIPVSLEMVSGKVSFLPVEAFQRRMSDMISPLARNARPANQGARKDGRGNEPLPLKNVRCAEPPEDSWKKMSDRGVACYSLTSIALLVHG